MRIRDLEIFLSLDPEWKKFGSGIRDKYPVMVRRGSDMVRRGSVIVRRGSVGSASACCKASPSSILGSAPHGGVSPLSRQAMRKWPPRMAMDKCIVLMWLNESMYVCYKIWKINKEWHPATKPLNIPYPQDRGEFLCGPSLKNLAVQCRMERPGPEQFFLL